MSGRLKLRRTDPSDVGYLVELARHPEVEPFLAPGVGVEERIEATFADGGLVDLFGLYVIESDTGQALGGLALELGSEHSRICNLRLLMVAPAARRSGVGARAVWQACHRALVQYGLHRVQAETYADNVAAQRCLERVGFVREGARRRAYWRRDQWLDGVLYGLLVEELRETGSEKFTTR